MTLLGPSSFTPPLIDPRGPLFSPTQGTTQRDVVKQAAAKYNVPDWILLGVWGLETDFGRNVKTSSAGAVGDFQFLPSTARGRNYPLTNSPNAQQFQQQAEAAAKYLSDLRKQTGSWNAALHSYSGGGYGENEVKAKAPSVPGGTVIEKAADTASDILSVPAKFLALLTDATVWLRLGEAIAGLVLIYFGLKQLGA